MSEIPLNKFEKRDLVIRLLNEGKTYREVCRIAHVSPRDIKPIAEFEQKLENNKRKVKKRRAKKPSISTQSFMLFKEGKKIDKVKIFLDIPFKKAETYWEQYLKSIGMEDCYEFYEDYRYEIPTLLSITAFIKRNNISGKDIANILRESKNVINLNRIISNLKAEIEKLEQIKKEYSSQILPPLEPLPRHPSLWNGYYY